MERQKALGLIEQAYQEDPVLTATPPRSHQWHLSRMVKNVGAVANGMDNALPEGRTEGHEERIAGAGAAALAWLIAYAWRRRGPVPPGLSYARRAVERECERRVEKYGNGLMHDETHLRVVVEEMYEVVLCMDETEPEDNMEEELTQVAASLAGWLEQAGENTRVKRDR